MYEPNYSELKTCLLEINYFQQINGIPESLYINQTVLNRKNLINVIHRIYQATNIMVRL